MLFKLYRVPVGHEWLMLSADSAEQAWEKLAKHKPKLFATLTKTQLQIRLNGIWQFTDRVSVNLGGWEPI